MQGGDSDPMREAKKKRWATRSSPLLTSFHLVQLLFIGCINYFAYFEKLSRCQGGILQVGSERQVFKETIRQRRSGCKSWIDSSSHLELVAYPRFRPNSVKARG